MFGRKSFATIRGMMAPLYNSVLMVGPVAAGFVFDWTGTYTPVLIAGGVLMLAAAVVFLRLEAPTLSQIRQPTESSESDTGSDTSPPTGPTVD